MIKLSVKLPKQLLVAVSGGVDSMAALHFLSRKHEVTAIHFNHKEGNSDAAQALVSRYCAEHRIKLQTYTLTLSKPTSESREEFWRNQRYAIFHSLRGLVVTAHTLDDCVETWIWSSLHGQGKIIPESNQNVIRPFRQTRKADFISYAFRHKVPYLEDSSNMDLSLTRNFIRHTLMPSVLQINPGIHKTILKQVCKHG